MMESNNSYNANLNKKEINAQVVVIGAGMAGVCAAIAAAREGKDTVLITDRPILGGSASSEVRVGPGGAANSIFNRYARETGIVEEISNKLRYMGQNAGKWRWFYFDQMYFDMVMSQKNLRLFLNTSVYKVETNPDKSIKSVSGLQLRAETKYTFTATIFIDCTGDGGVGYLAGADYRMGREARAEYNEIYAPETADTGTMGASLLFTSVNAGHPTKFNAPDWAIKVPELETFDRIHRNMGRQPDGSFYGFWWVEYGGHFNSIYDDGEAVLHLRKLVLGIWDYIKNSGDFKDVENQELNWIGYLPGKRESRRLMGTYIASSNDFIEQREFDDKIGYTGWPIDVHPPKGYLADEPGCTHYYIPGITDIPFRVLYSRNIPNLLFAGRHISTTHEGLGTLRLICTTAVMGQAVGIAASMCIDNSCRPLQISEKYIEDLQYKLAREDSSMLQYQLSEDNDFSRNAIVTASSTARYELINPEHFKYLDLSYGLILAAQDAVDSVSLYLEAEIAIDAIVDIYTCDDKVHNYRANKLYKSTVISVSKKGWYNIDVGLVECPGKKIFVMVRKNSKIRLYMSRERLTCALGIQSSEPVLKSDTIYRTLNDGEYITLTPCFKISPKQNFYNACDVVNGYSRPWAVPNMWMSDVMNPQSPEWINLSFNGYKTISIAELVFNSDLNAQFMYNSINAVNCEMIKSYKLTAITEAEEVTLVSEINNYMRFKKHTFKPIKAKGLKLYVYETWGGKHAEVFDIRVY